MTEQQDRPYVCSAPGCSQRFQLEEHLSIHRHKHEMTLKFCSIKTDAAFTGDTPTPTKFLQNCDEVGLFKEIEEEFLQAQEEEKKQMLPQNGPSCMNQLKGQAPGHLGPQPLSHPQLPPHHTHSHSPACPPPHQQAHHQHHPPHPRSQALQHPPAHGPLVVGPSCSLAPQQAPGSVITQSHSHSGPVPSPLSCLLHMKSRHRQPLAASLPGTLPDPAMQGAAQHMARLKHPLGLPFQHHPRMMPMNSGVPPMAHMMDMMSPRQQAPPLQHHPQLSPPPVSYQQCFHAPPPQHMPRLHQNAPPTQAHQSPPPHLHQGSPPAAPLSAPAQLSPIPSQPSQCQHSLSQAGAGCAGPSGPGLVPRRRRTSEQDPDERRQKFLERNRAAATRCRQKRKLWVSSLEKKAEELTHTNLQLQNEVTSLRSEVGQLKQILLTHKDCPVTARQRESQSFSSD